MKSFDFSKNGLYCLLKTAELQRRLAAAQKNAVSVFKPGDGDQIARLMAQSIGDEVEAYILAKLQEAESASPQTPLRDALAPLPASDDLRLIAEHALPLDGSVLTEIKSLPNAAPTVRPNTSLTESDLIVPGDHAPQLGNEIKRELASCDKADWLVSFIKLSAIRGLYPTLQAFCNIKNPDGSPRLRIATTTYMGATDAAALKLLFALPNTQIKVSFDSSLLRLHAKAYIFRRDSGFGSAYVGSANLSDPALRTGLEWTVKVSQFEIPHLWDRSVLSFEACWNDPSFEVCQADALETRIKPALHRARLEVSGAQDTNGTALPLFTPRPHLRQQTMLDELMAERGNGRHRHLIVSATGTGKTFVAAFDYAQMARQRGGNPTFLFIVHRSDILRQARDKYRAVLGMTDFGALVADNATFTSRDARQCFCTIQSWRTRIRGAVPPDFYDLIVIDECHHAPADSYQALLDYYRAPIDAGQTDLLGLTATPFRTDGRDLREDFGGGFTHELTLADAIAAGDIVPFTYFGIDDDTDFTGVNWNNKAQAERQVEAALAQNGRHLENIRTTLAEYVADIANLRALAFCAGLNHAKAACDYMNANGVRSVVLSGDSTQAERDQAIRDMEARPPRLHIIFTADLFNEGVDIPCVNTALMLRPTNSPLIFIQQLGRGLRQAPLQYGKSDLVVLDFVGNHNRDYQGFLRFQSLTTRRDIPIQRQIEEGMPFLPAGCSISLTKQSREKVLANIAAYMKRLRGRTLERFLVDAIHNANRRLKLTELMDAMSVASPTPIYRVGAPAALTDLALHGTGIPEKSGAFFQTLAQNDSPRLLRIWERLLAQDASLGAEEKPETIRLAKFFLLATMFPGLTVDQADAEWERLAQKGGLVQDLVEFLTWRSRLVTPMKAVSYEGRLSGLVELHRTYTSKQIAAALGLKGAVIQGGSYHDTRHGQDVYFITRQKSENEFTPTTRYDDYAKSPTIFHWESPARTAADSAEANRFADSGVAKLLFLRASKRRRMDITDEQPTSPTASGYIFLGAVRRVLAQSGSRPVAYDLELEHPLPATIFDFARGA